MPFLFVHTINSDSAARDDGQDYATPEDALKSAIWSASVLAAEELQGGKTSSAIEVRIEEEDGSAVLRAIVSLSVSPLMVAG